MIEQEHVVVNYWKKLRSLLATYVDATNKPIPGITKKGDFNSLYPNSIGFSSLHPLAPQISTLSQYKKAARRITGPVSKKSRFLDNWYAVCMPGLFRPSVYLKKIVAPFELLFASHFVVGVHIRSVKSYSDWLNENPFLVSRNCIERMLPRIREQMEKENSILFFTADSDEFLPIFEEAFPNAVVQIDGLSRDHVGKNPSESAVVRSVVELYLLSLCDYLVVTEGSGFSNVAVNLNSKNCSVDYFSPQ